MSDDLTPDPDLIPRMTQPRPTAKHRFCDAVMRWKGWTQGPPPPDIDRCLVLAVPHTSWWDGFWMLGYAWWWNWDINWLVKDTIVKGPFGRFLRSTGAVAVNRSAPQGLVGQLAEAFQTRDRLILSVPPEGTRSRRDFWKSGFYHIARAADVPVCLSYLDYEKKQAGFGPCFYLTGDISADMDRIWAYYEGVTALYPDKYTPPRLRAEDEGDAS